jgi:predicted house-cleaning noncanonical NTP pyrophosphatase (MazG superfamily)
MLWDRAKLAQGYAVKLVRDRIPLILGTPATVTYEEPTHQFHVEMLRRRLMEEATEYLLNPGVNELADLLETLRGLSQVDLRRGWHEVVEAAERKRIERGGLTAGTVMVVHHPADVLHDLPRSAKARVTVYYREDNPAGDRWVVRIVAHDEHTDELLYESEVTAATKGEGERMLDDLTRMLTEFGGHE